MADNENVTIRIRVRADTKEIDRVQAKLAALCAQADKCSDTFANLGKSFDDSSKDIDRNTKSSDKNRKSLSALAKAGDKVGEIFGKTWKLALKGTLIQTAALAAALSSVNLLLKTGQVLSRAWGAAVNGLGVAAANAAAGILSLAAVFTQAMRQFAAAQSSASYKGSFAGASQGLRTMQTDTELAVFGIKSLTQAFAAASKNAPVTGATVKNLRGLADFAVASGDMEKGLTAAANLVSMLQSGKAAGSEGVLKAASELGPEFEKAFKEAIKGGKATNEELLKMFSSGELAQKAGVAGTAQNVRGTFLGQLKAFGTEFQTIFADIGQTFIEPVQRAFNQIRQIFIRTIVSISGNLGTFARGPLVDNLVKVVDKIGRMTALLFNEYLPKTGEVVDNFVSKWRSFTGAIDRGFDKFERFLNRFSDASAVLNRFFGTILKAIGGGMSEGFENFADLIVKNEKDFQKFGEGIGKLIKEIGRLFSEIRDAFFQALPAINGIVSAISALVGALSQLVNLLGPLGALAGPLLMMGMTTKGRGRLRAVGRNAAPIAAVTGAAALGAVPGIGGALTMGALGAYGGKMAYGGMTKAGNAIMNSRFGGAGSKLGYRAAGMANMSAARFAGAGAVAGLGAYGTNMAMNYVEGAFGNTAATVGTGAVGGALTGAAVGSIVPVIGTAAGAVIGAAIGAIAGFMKSGEAKKKARKAGEGFANGYADNINLALQHGAIDQAQKMVNDFNDNLMKATEGMNRAGTARGKAEEVFGKRMEETQPVIDQFNRNLNDLQKITGKTREEIIAAAQAAEVDLGSNMKDLQKILSETGLAVGRFGSDFDAAMNEVIGSAAASIRQTFDILQAPKVMDQAAIALQEKIRGGGLTDDDRAQFLETLFTQAQLVTGGDPLETMRYIRENIGTATAPGVQFTTQGSRLYGTQQDFFGGGGGQMVTGALDIMGAGLRDVIRQNIISEVGRVGGTIDVAALNRSLAGMQGAQLEALAGRVRQGGFLSDTSGQWGRGGERGDMSFFVNQQLTDIVGTNLDLQRSENADFLSQFGTESEKMIAGFGTALDPLEQGMTTFNNNIQLLIAAVKGDGDTASPRRNFVDTLSRHSQFDMAIAGNRTITSGMRSNRLGSLSSDHLAGRAYDLTGQNLGMYQAAVRAAGGFAEFHGNGAARHLHVVPGSGPVGDTATPYMGAPTGSSTMVTSNDSYNIVINASPGMNEKQIADEVMARIQRMQRNARERM